MDKSIQIDNTGIGATYATFFAKNLTPKDVGKAVTRCGDNEVSLTYPGCQVLGRLEYVQDSLCTVQIMGITDLPLDLLFYSDPIHNAATDSLTDTSIQGGDFGSVRFAHYDRIKVLSKKENGYVSVLL